MTAFEDKEPVESDLLGFLFLLLRPVLCDLRTGVFGAPCTSRTSESAVDTLSCAEGPSCSRSAKNPILSGAEQDEME